MVMETKHLFDRLRDGRVTDSGKACVEVAEHIFSDGDSERRSGEARQWVALGLKCDAATTATKVKEIEEELAKRADRASKRAKMRVVPGGSA